MACASIRVATLSDAGEIADIYAPYVTGSTVSFEAVPPAAAEIESRMRAIAPRYPFLVCELDGAVAGYAYASRFKERFAYQWNAELSVYVRTELAGRGIGTALYRALIDILKLQRIHNVYGCIGLPNPGSLRLHECMGFTRIGVFEKTGFKHGQWLDMVWYGRNILPHDMQPEIPVPFSEVDGGALASILAACGKLVVQ